MNTNDLREEDKQPELRGFAKIRHITSHMCAECGKDAKYVVCFLGAAIIRLLAILFSNFLLLWIMSFVDDGLITNDQSKDLYQFIILTSTIATIVLTPLLGYIGDKVPSTIIVPVAFTLRGICGYSFMWMKSPKSFFSVTLCCLLIIFTVIEAISIEVLLMRGMPSQIRGTMMGMFAFCGQLGTLMFTLIGGQLFDRIDRNAPFVFLAMMDTLLVLLTLTLICLGKLKRHQTSD